MNQTRARFIQRPSGVALTAVGHLLLGAVCLYTLMAHGLLVGFWEGVGLGFGMMFIGATTTGVLTHLNRGFKWLWIVTFCILPFAYVVPSYLLFLEMGDTFPITYWTTFSIAVACACYIGSIVGAEYEMWNKLRQPTRGRFIRRLIRWLS